MPLDQLQLNQYCFLLQISVFVTDHPEIKEVDLNQIIVNSKKAVAVDSRIILNDDLDERQTL